MGRPIFSLGNEWAGRGKTDWGGNSGLLHREKGFLCGKNTSENGACQSFGVDKCLKMLYF